MSIYSALSLALVGSAGKSRSEMLAALKLGIEVQDFDVLIRSVGEGLQKVPEGDIKNTLVQANAMFVEGTMAVLPAFSESLKSHFKSMAQEVRFSHRLSIFPSRLILYTLPRRPVKRSTRGLRPILRARSRIYSLLNHSTLRLGWF